MEDITIPGFEASPSGSDSQLRLDVKRVDSDTLYIKVVGSLDTYNSNFFTQQVHATMEAGFKNFIFDASQLSYASSTGIGSFTAIMKSTKTNGGSIRLAGVANKVRDVFSLLGFTQFFPFHGSVEEALDAHTREKSGESSEVFPAVIQCPICEKKLKVKKSGIFRCPECKSNLAIDERANVQLK